MPLSVDDVIRQKFLNPRKSKERVFVRVLLDATNCGSLFQLPYGRVYNKLSAATNEGNVDWSLRRIAETGDECTVAVTSWTGCLKALGIAIAADFTIVNLFKDF